MAIIQLPDNKPLPHYVRCVLCGKLIPLDSAAAGLLNADNQQQFACNGHFWNPHQFIAGWADFMAAERAKRTCSQFALEYGEGMDAQFMY